VPSVDAVMYGLKAKGSDKTRAILVRHGGSADHILGVSVADLKVMAKGLKGQQELALGLYATGFMEAMYLAGMVASGKLMSEKQLQAWADGSRGISMISEHTVPWVAVESPAARALALKWMGSKTEHVAASGWCTYAGLLATTPDEELDLVEIQGLLERVVKEIDAAPNRTRYTMNGFVISAGTYVKPLLKQAKETAKKLGAVSVNMGETSCKVPLATEYIAKIEGMDRVGHKRKTIRC
jgi:3-methyladenine DNA glycosylase AlkD